MNWVTDESSAVAPTRSTASPEPGRTSAVASASATRVSASERPRPEHGVVDGVVEHGPVRADREPGERAELGEDGRDPARGAAGDQHERHAGRDEPVDDGGSPGG